MNKQQTMLALITTVAMILGFASCSKDDDDKTGSKSSQNPSFTANGVSFNMVKVTGGTFQMGSSTGLSNERPVHSVTLSDYYIGETEVTQQLWTAVMGTNPSYFKGDKLPVEKVSWNDACSFIAKLNELTGMTFRLPTEAEWEFAAKGGNSSKGYVYSGSNNINDVAWYEDNSNDRTHEVATKAPNELGIYDMSGNVYEWCYDIAGEYSSEAQTNPNSPGGDIWKGYHMLRGGAWDYSDYDCSPSFREWDEPTYADKSFGFRLAM